MTIQINPIASPRIITIPQNDGDSITIQSLVNQVRNWESQRANLCYDSLLAATGKEDLGGGGMVGVTAKLLNAKIKFADRTSLATCQVGGGNLVAVDTSGDSIYPIEAASNITVALAQSASPTLLQIDAIDTMQTNVLNVESLVNNMPTTLANTHGSGLWAKRRGIFK